MTRPKKTTAWAALLIAAIAALSGCKAAVPASAVPTLGPPQLFVNTVRGVEQGAAAPFTDAALIALGQTFCSGLGGPSETRDQALVEGIAAGAAGHFGEAEFDLASVIEGAAIGALCPPSSGAPSASGPPSASGASPATGSTGTIPPVPSIPPIDQIRGVIEAAIRAGLEPNTAVVAAVRQVHLGDGRLTIEIDTTAAAEISVSYEVTKFLGDPQNGLVSVPPLLRALLVDGPHFAIALTVHGARTATSTTTFATLLQMQDLSEADWATQAGFRLE